MGDARSRLRDIEAGSIQCIVTSPPYYGLRSYLPDDHEEKFLEVGIESNLQEYLENIVGVFREARKCLADNGVLWLNLGDSFRNKRLLGVPWRVAFALEDDGWIIRSEVIWHKNNPMPENVSDRPTRSHEQVFLLTKRMKYKYNSNGFREPSVTPIPRNSWEERKKRGESMRRGSSPSKMRHSGGVGGNGVDRNARSVWSINTEPFPGSHFAVFPEEIARRCILLGSDEGDTVLDPFIGSGTTMLVSNNLGRSCVGIDINEEYAKIAKDRVESSGDRFPCVRVDKLCNVV